MTYALVIIVALGAKSTEYKYGGFPTLSECGIARLNFSAVELGPEGHASVVSACVPEPDSVPRCPPAPAKKGRWVDISPNVHLWSKR